MCNEDYCSYEVAKLLKEKGFDELCKYLYKDNGERYTLASTCYQNVCDDGECLCPTHQMTMKWLREVHDLHIIAYPYNAFNKKKYCCQVYKTFNLLGCGKYINERLDSYEEAVEAALKYCLEKLI